MLQQAHVMEVQASTTKEVAVRCAACALRCMPLSVQCHASRTACRMTRCCEKWRESMQASSFSHLANREVFPLASAPRRFPPCSPNPNASLGRVHRLRRP